MAGASQPDANSLAHGVLSAKLIDPLVRVEGVEEVSLSVQPADEVIEPDVTGFDLGQLSRTDEIAAVGEATARMAIPEIEGLLRQLDNKLSSVV